jgi:hypothetical protein
MYSLLLHALRSPIVGVIMPQQANQQHKLYHYNSGCRNAVAKCDVCTLNSLVRSALQPIKTHCTVAVLTLQATRQLCSVVIDSIRCRHAEDVIL